MYCEHFQELDQEVKPMLVLNGDEKSKSFDTLSHKNTYVPILNGISTRSVVDDAPSQNIYPNVDRDP